MEEATVQRVWDLIHPYDLYSGFQPLNKELDGVELDGGVNVKQLQELIEQHNPKIVFEIGSWRGSSAINIARKLSNDACIVCIDTWLGSLDFIDDKGTARYNQLKLKHGRPNFYYTFLSNVVLSGEKNKIIPFSTTSRTASQFFKKFNIKADLIYIDGSHDGYSVREDIESYWSLLRNENSVMCGDDFDQAFHDLQLVVVEFANKNNLELILDGGFWVYKRK